MYSLCDRSTTASLHIVLGVTNTLLGKLQTSRPQLTQKWLKACIVSRKSTFGRVFNGNGCRSLLKKTFLLEPISQNDEEGLMYAKLFKSFNQIVISCFGTTQHPNYATHVQNFERLSYEADLKGTPKINLLLRHVVQFLANKPHGLSVYDQHAFEGVYYDFGEHFKFFKRDPDLPQFAETFVRAVVTCNARHFVK